LNKKKSEPESSLRERSASNTRCEGFVLLFALSEAGGETDLLRFFARPEPPFFGAMGKVVPPSGGDGSPNDRVAVARMERSAIADSAQRNPGWAAPRISRCGGDGRTGGPLR